MGLLREPKGVSSVAAPMVAIDQATRNARWVVAEQECEPDRRPQARCYAVRNLGCPGRFAPASPICDAADESFCASLWANHGTAPERFRFKDGVGASAETSGPGRRRAGPAIRSSPTLDAWCHSGSERRYCLARPLVCARASARVS